MQEALPAEFPQINHISLHMFVWNWPSLWPLSIRKPFAVSVNDAPICKGEPVTWWQVGLLQPAGTLSQQMEMKVHQSIALGLLTSVHCPRYIRSMKVSVAVTKD